MIAGARHLASAVGERREVLDEEDRQWIAGAEACRPPLEL
jgi:hypothetical protein